MAPNVCSANSRARAWLQGEAATEVADASKIFLLPDQRRLPGQVPVDSWQRLELDDGCRVQIQSKRSRRF
jgi:hypothetical protein